MRKKIPPFFLSFFPSAVVLPLPTTLKLSAASCWEFSGLIVATCCWKWMWTHPVHFSPAISMASYLLYTCNNILTTASWKTREKFQAFITSSVPQLDTPMDMWKMYCRSAPAGGYLPELAADFIIFRTKLENWELLNDMRCCVHWWLAVSPNSWIA